MIKKNLFHQLPRNYGAQFFHISAFQVLCLQDAFTLCTINYYEIHNMNCDSCHGLLFP